MDWYQLYQDMFQTYIKSQENMWQSWESAMKDAQHTQSRMAWEQSVSVWEKSTSNLITSQKRWLTSSVSNLASTVQDKTVQEAYAKNLNQLIDTWEQTQLVLWKNWYTMLKQAYPAAEKEAPQASFNRVLESWTEQSQKLMQAQMEWASKWAAPVSSADKE